MITERSDLANALWKIENGIPRMESLASPNAQQFAVEILAQL